MWCGVRKEKIVGDVGIDGLVWWMVVRWFLFLRFFWDGAWTLEGVIFGEMRDWEFFFRKLDGELERGRETGGWCFKFAIFGCQKRDSMMGKSFEWVVRDDEDFLCSS